MAKKETTVFDNAFYHAINQMYIVNYQCLQILNEDSPFDDKSPENLYRAYFDAEDGQLFGDRGVFIENWLSAKFEAFKKIRAKLISDIEEGVVPADPTEAFNKEKAELIKKYNELYGENRKFDEVFRGTEILDKRFNADFIADANGAPLSVENEKYAEFCMAYTKYVLDFQMAQFYGTFKDIYEALCEDLTASGYRSLYFNNPANPKVKVLSGEFFNEIGRDVDKLSNFLLEKSETLKREIVKMQKTKMLESDSAMQEQYNAAVAALNETENNILVLEHIYNWLDAIYERFKSANSVTIDFKSRFVDKSVYLLTGNGFGGKNKLEINDVYIHQNEIDYVTTILKVIAEAKPLIDKIKAHFGILESAKERQ